MTKDDVLRLCSLRNCNVTGIDIDPVFMAQQGVVGWVCALHPELKCEALMKQLFAIVLQNQRNIRLCDKIAKALGDEGIEMALLKGAALMTCFYKETSQRPIGDIDIWVRHDDAYRAHEILQSLSDSYVPAYRTNVLHESLKTHLPEVPIDGQIVELHYNFYSPDSQANIIEPIDAHVNRDGKYAVMDDEAMLYHLTTHMIKSRKTVGLRAGWVVDLVMLMDKWGDKTADICRKAMALNPSMSAEMLDIWRYVVSLVPEKQSVAICKALCMKEKIIDASFLECTDEGYKRGLAVRLNSMRCLLKASVKIVSEAHGVGNKLKAIRNIAHDVITRQETN